MFHVQIEEQKRFDSLTGEPRNERSIWIVDDKQEYLALVCQKLPYELERGAPKPEATAALMAAAPEMLDALKYIRDNCSGLPAYARALAHKAILKVEGESDA